MSDIETQQIRLRCLELATTLVNPSVDKRVYEIISVANDLYNNGVLCETPHKPRDTLSLKRKAPSTS